MAQIRRNALMPYSTAQMYALVDDIRAYPEFLPWCTATEILAEAEEEIRAAMELSKGRIRKRFSTINRRWPGQRIEMRLLEGPFKHLRGLWRFEALNESACKVSIDMEFEFSNKLVAVAFGPIFQQVVGSLVDAFMQRAKAVYG